MKIVPTFDNVAVVLDQAQNTTKSGIALPGNMAQAQTTGKIVAAGPYVNDMEPGDRVLLAEARDTQKSSVLLDNGEQVLVVNAEYILAVIKE